jgi:hypothetical protein
MRRSRNIGKHLRKELFSNLSSSPNESNEMKQNKRQMGLVADMGKI